MILRPSLMTFVLICCLHWSCCCQSSSAADVLTYEQHIRPIFRAHCFDCHGATEDLEGNLDLLPPIVSDDVVDFVEGLPEDFQLPVPDIDPTNGSEVQSAVQNPALAD